MYVCRGSVFADRISVYLDGEMIPDWDEAETEPYDKGPGFVLFTTCNGENFQRGIVTLKLDTEGLGLSEEDAWRVIAKY